MTGFVRAVLRWVSNQPTETNGEGATGRPLTDALKGWTGKGCATVVYDSTADEFTDEGLFQSVKGKPDIAVVATTTDGDVFGGFYTVAVTGQDEWFMDPDMFIFTFEAHGRCATPRKFAVKRKWRDTNSVKFFKDFSAGWYVEFCGGGGWFFLGSEKSNTKTIDLARCFVGIEHTTLTGTNRERFTCCRLVAVQLE